MLLISNLYLLLFERQNRDSPDYKINRKKQSLFQFLQLINAIFLKVLSVIDKINQFYLLVSGKNRFIPLSFKFIIPLLSCDLLMLKFRNCPWNYSKYRRRMGFLMKFLIGLKFKFDFSWKTYSPIGQFDVDFFHVKKLSNTYGPPKPKCRFA